MHRCYEIVVLSKGAFARTLRIYAPRNADRAIIMHDGQNVFYDDDASFKKSWRALDVLKSRGIKNTAIIGIDSQDATRMDDSLPFPAQLELLGHKRCGGKADVYCDYIENMVIPYLDKRFGFKFYGMLGSSAGAAVTLHYAAKNDGRMRAYGLFSAPLFVAAEAYDNFFASATFPAAMYLVYTGGSESADAGEYSKLLPDLYVDSAFAIVKALRKSGVTDLKLRLINKNIHDELSWREPESEFFNDFSKL